MVIGEFDGRMKYTRDADGRSANEIVYEEKRREDRLREAGWTIARWSYDDLLQPGLLANRLQAAFARAKR